MYVPKAFTLHVEVRPDREGIWLCLDNGAQTIPIAQFASPQAAELYKEAARVAFAKAHTMGLMGI